MPVKITQFPNELAQTDDFRRIVFEQTPLIDVRAPIEFQQGAFPSATNLPLMSDDERHKVGLCYKQYGNATAVKLGHQLVSPTVRAPRIQSWCDFIQQNPSALLYCFRGGMRSKIAQQWLAEQGHNIVRLKGGYKAFRRFLIDFLDATPERLKTQGVKPWVLAGRTGSGKTRVLQQLPSNLDLEGLANHRGSAFGRHVSPQPSQIDFENQLAMALMRLTDNLTPIKNLVIEDEARNIGSVSLNKPLFDFLKSNARVVLETPLEERLQITFDEYVTQAQQEYASLDAWESFMQNAFERIRRRLGGERHHKVVSQFNNAFARQKNNGATHNHLDWIKTLLIEYYDPMYDFQIQKTQIPIAFKGDATAVIAFINAAE